MVPRTLGLIFAVWMISSFQVAHTKKLSAKDYHISNNEGVKGKRASLDARGEENPYMSVPINGPTSIRSNDNPSNPDSVPVI